VRGCKGCKRDCPTGVDMARMKIEFPPLQEAPRPHAQGPPGGPPSRLCGHGQPLAGLLNLRNKSGPLAAAGEKLLGFSASAACPNGSATHFFNSGIAGVEPRGTVLPARQGRWCCSWTPSTASSRAENARAAFTLLQAAGYTVHIASKEKSDGKHLCCGRTYLASGMVDEARAKAAEMLDALHPLAAQGIPVVGLEPSCLLSCVTR
jgi:Fe-S oxidoreductase